MLLMLAILMMLIKSLGDLLQFLRYTWPLHFDDLPGLLILIFLNTWFNFPDGRMNAYVLQPTHSRFLGSKPNRKYKGEHLGLPKSILSCSLYPNAGFKRMCRSCKRACVPKSVLVVHAEPFDLHS